MSEGAVVVAPEVADALASGAGVVALESTILAHGFPHPDGRRLADELESTVRARGAVPATIAVLDGKLCVGVDAGQLDRITDPDARLAKAAALDLAALTARHASAATTVSATCAAAALVGIRVFATGGIGGVHRGDSGDVSSDLGEIARQPVAVVSAGAKAILDLPRTLEALETLGVPVIGYRTSEFPAFYSRTSGLALELHIDDVDELAALLHARFDLYRQGGLLVCNPIPEAAALDPTTIEASIAEALVAATAAGIAGKALTPFLLAHIGKHSGGTSVTANRALAVHNAAVAAELAVAYERRRSG